MNYDNSAEINSDSHDFDNSHQYDEAATEDEYSIPTFSFRPLSMTSIILYLWKRQNLSWTSVFFHHVVYEKHKKVSGQRLLYYVTSST